MDLHLPEECWELIFKFTDEDDYRYLEPLSLVSTTFLVITNRVRSTITITNRALPFLSLYLVRFRNLKKMKLRSFSENLDMILTRISLSELSLDSIDVSEISRLPDFGKLGMTTMNLKKLNCSGVRNLRDYDLYLIGVCFPFLQKLDISYPDQMDHSFTDHVSDSGIIHLSSKLKGLLKIDISGNNLLTDKSVISLSTNCVLLREIILRDCDFISSECINFVLSNSQNLESLAITGMGLKPKESFSDDALLCSRSLSKLDLSESFLSDELVCLIADANLPLKKVVLPNCYCLTFNGIFYLLSKYQTLTHLDLDRASFLTDQMIMELGKFLGSLTFINLSFCAKLTGLAFFSIIENCVSLKSMRMEGTNFGVEEYSKELDIKSGIKSLFIARNNNLRDQSLEKLAFHCPFLETLKVTHCPGITEDGILEVLKNCQEMKSLDISRCTGIKTLGLDFEVPKLDSLRACGTWIDDDALEMISKRCKALLLLDLKGCLNVRSRGVKEVVESCKRLREINLRHCLADDGIYTWMMCSNSSLRKIIPPCGFSPTRRFQNFLLRHGCVISQDSPLTSPVACCCTSQNNET